MSKFLDTFKELMQLGIYLVLAGALILNLPALSVAFTSLVNRVSNVSSLKVAGVELGFDESSVAAKLAATDLGTGAKTHVFELIRKLDPEQFERLVYVSDLANLCEYENPTPEMRQQVASDYLLRANGLTTITKSTELRDRIAREIARRTAQGHPSDIGNPLSCYYMTLTDTGRDVTTALIKTFAEAFGSRPAFTLRKGRHPETEALLAPAP